MTNDERERAAELAGELANKAQEIARLLRVAGEETRIVQVHLRVKGIGARINKDGEIVAPDNLVKQLCKAIEDEDFVVMGLEEI